MRKRIGRIAMIALAVSGMVLGGCAKKSKELIGFDTDFAKAVGTVLNVKVQFQEIVWEQKEIELSAKNIDVIWNGFTITEERKAALDFTVPYMVNKQVIISKNAVTAIDSTKNNKVAVEAGSAGSDAFDADTAFKASTKVEVTDQITALTEVLSGTSDYAIIDSVMAGYYLSDTSSYGKSLKVLSGYEKNLEYYGIGARKGEDALVAKLNEAIQTCYENGTTAKVAEKYGLTEALVAPASFLSYSSLNDTSSYDYIQKKGTLIVGYTVFAPIAYLG
jgi:polar amino acid transport system substrate-binding protein